MEMMYSALRMNPFASGAGGKKSKVLLRDLIFQLVIRSAAVLPIMACPAR
jgi:hypothetical protein